MNNWRRCVANFLFFIAILVAIVVFGNRNLLQVGQFGFSNMHAIPVDVATRELAVFLYSWNPTGLTPPIALHTFYQGEFPTAAGLGSPAFVPPMRTIFMAVFYWFFNGNAELAQHIFIFMWMPVSGIAMYLFLGRFSIRYPARFAGSLIYMINPQTMMSAIGNAMFYPVYALQPIILFFALGFMESTKKNWRDLLLVALFVGLAGSWLWFLIPAMFVFFLLTAYVLINLNKQVLYRSLTLFLFTIGASFLLQLPYLYSVIMGIANQESLGSLYTLINPGYAIENQISALRYSFATTTPINTLRFISINTQNIPSWWYGGKEPWNALGFVYPILAISSFFLIRERKKIRYALIFAVIAIFSTGWMWWTGAGVTGPIYRFLPMLLVFNTPEWFEWITVISLAVLISFSLDRIFEVSRLHLKCLHVSLRKKMMYATTFLLIMLAISTSILSYNWLLFTGDWGLSMMPFGMAYNNYNPFMNPIYNRMHDWLVNNDPEYWNSRVMILPWGYDTPYYRYVVSPTVLVPPNGIMNIFFRNVTSHLGTLLGFFNVKYIFLNLAYASVGAPFAYSPEKYVNFLNIQEDLKLVLNGTDFLVYRNNQFTPLISAYDAAMYLIPDNSTSELDVVRLLSVMPGFNLSNQLLVFGDGIPNLEKSQTLNASRTLIFFGNSSVSYDLDRGSPVDNFIYVVNPNYLSPQELSLTRFDARLGGRVNGSLVWNSSGYMRIPSSHPLNKTFEAITMSVWINPLSINWGSVGTIFSNNASAYGGPFRWVSGDRAYTPVGTIPDTSRTFPNPPLGEWTFLTLVFNGTHLLSYTNGALEHVTSASANSFNLTGDNFLGSTLGKDIFFDGYMKNFQMYSVALTSKQIHKLYEAGPVANTMYPGLVGYWPLSQDFGAADASAFHNDGTLVGNYSWETIKLTMPLTDPTAALGYTLKIGQGSLFTSVYVLHEGNYGINIRGRGALYVNGTLATITSDSSNSLNWYNVTASLKQGKNEIVVAGDAESLIDFIVLSMSSENNDLQKILDSSMNEPSTTKQISYSHYTVTVKSTTLLVLWESFAKDWMAYTKTGVSFERFNASLWGNGFYYSQGYTGEVTLYYTPQNTRNIVVSAWAIVLFSFTAGAFFFSRQSIILFLKRIKSIFKVR